MTVTSVVLPGGRLSMDAVAERLSDEPDLAFLLAAGSLCSDASVRQPEQEGEDVRVLGDPTEAALVLAAGKAGLSRDALRSRFPRIAEVPFESDRKRMTTVHRLEGEPRVENTDLPVDVPVPLSSAFLVITKGAVDGMLPVCTRVFRNGELRDLDDSTRDEILNANEALAGEGVRVLALACRPLDDEPGAVDESLEQELVYLGLVGMIDPVREEAVPAVQSCRNAGIRVVMITGDHPLTAKAIAGELGLGDSGRVMSGADLGGATVADLTEEVGDVAVFARVSPEHKMTIIDALQANGDIVSMTGDGVNDAPALKSADIGVSMGIMGTDVARESSDMVLLDDNFATIVAAVREGRTIYDNIRKFVKYILTGNAGEIFVMLAGPLLGMPVPLLPIQILWINLVTDGVPAVALGYEEAEENVMARPPFHPGEGVFSRGVGAQIAAMGCLIGVLSCAVGYSAWQVFSPGREWQTMVFTTLTFCQMVYALCVRRNRGSLFTNNPLRNKPLTAAVAVTLVLQLAIVYVPSLNRIFSTRPLSLLQLGICIGASAGVVAASELLKWVSRTRDHAAS
jgi:Ca2+-transporting ATPase